MNAQMREMKTMLPAQMPRSPGLSDMEGHSSFDRDQYDLARLGKKQVLKVDFAFFKLCCGNTLSPPALAEFRFHVYAGLQLYHDDNVGRCTGVRITQNSQKSQLKPSPVCFL